MRRPMTITLMAVFALFCLGNGYADADKAIAAAEDRKPILVTGFEPFGGERLNSTEQVLGTRAIGRCGAVCMQYRVIQYTRA